MEVSGPLGVKRIMIGSPNHANAASTSSDSNGRRMSLRVSIIARTGSLCGLLMRPLHGDTSPTEETIKACNGCDVLIHEVRTLELFSKLSEERRSFGAKNHTTSEQLVALATKAQPGL